jgi:hypothetical protein
MSSPCADRRQRGRWLLGAVPGLLAVLILPRPVIALGAQDQPQTPQSALRVCADLAADAARLACYDRLAGRTAAGTPVRQAGAPRAAPPAAAAAPAAPVPAPPPSESFGKYAAEHPKPPPAAKSLEAAVVALGKSPSGKMIVTLEGGALWELDAADPLLAVGDVVTITRAAFTSYIMSTPTRRTHHVRRLR